MHIPPGFTTVFPYIFATDARNYLTFLVQGLGGETLHVLASPDGTVRNAHVRFGDTTIMVSEARDGFQPSRGTYYLYVEDADALYSRALTAGATSEQEPKDEFWGDRTAMVKDPFGNTWSVATHKEDVSPDEMGRRAAAAMS